MSLISEKTQWTSNILFGYDKVQNTKNNFYCSYSISPAIDIPSISITRQLNNKRSS
jgi:hypothetical protein